MPQPAPPALRTLFAGTPEFAVPALEALIDAGLAPVAVLSQPDRPAGRGRKLQSSPVKRCALDHGLTVLQPPSLRGSEVLAELAAFEADLMVVAAYGLILPQAVLDLPRYGCWNIHASLLPRWRGAAPIQRAIEAGDTESGICIMQMEAGLDTGPVFARTTTPISSTDTGGSLHDRLSALGAEALIDCVRRLQSGQLAKPEPQDDSQATYAHKIDKAEARIDWTRPAPELERLVRAFNPWPVAWCELDGERIRVWNATAIGLGRVIGPAGSVLAADDTGLDICAGEGGLRLLEVQRPGGRRIPIPDFLRARSVRHAS